MAERGIKCTLRINTELRSVVLSRLVMFDSVTPWTVAHQAPLSRDSSRQEYWSGLLSPPPGDLPNPGIEPRNPTLQVDSLLSETPGKPWRYWLTVGKIDEPQVRAEGCWHVLPSHLPQWCVSRSSGRVLRVLKIKIFSLPPVSEKGAFSDASFLMPLQ